MDAESFARWVNDLALEYKDANRLIDPAQVSAVNGFVGWLITKYHLDREREAQDKLADPSCCEGVCKEDA